MPKNIKTCRGFPDGMVRELPVFRGYTVDIRLRQFRKVSREMSSIEFIDFSSEEGDLLLGDYIESLDSNSPKDKEILDSIFNLF